MNSPKVVHLSSGAVYGPQTFNKSTQFEVQKSSMATPYNLYAQTKQITENLLNLESANGLISASNPRLFAFAGPHISLVEHFAVGNFMNNALNNQDIIILGNPETVRTYLYPTDLINSILSLMWEPLSQEINLGSDKEITMLDLAKLISSLTTKTKIKVLGVDQAPNRYVPPNLFQSGGVEVTVSLEEAINRWYRWLTIQNESKADS
jgi:dTDP-glucose 4,6-dehydratase